MMHKWKTNLESTHLGLFGVEQRASSFDHDVMAHATLFMLIWNKSYDLMEQITSEILDNRYYSQDQTNKKVGLVMFTFTCRHYSVSDTVAIMSQEIFHVGSPIELIHSDIHSSKKYTNCVRAQEWETTIEAMP